MIRALVTGAKGQLGMALRELAPSYPMVAFDFKSKNDLDVTDSAKINLIFEKERYDFCINCASITKVERDGIAFKANAKG